MLARTLAAALTAVLFGSAAPASAQTGAAAGDAQAVVEAERVDAATVEIDGEPLFRVRGVSGFPAARRAAAVAERVENLARDRRFDPASLAIVQADGFTAIVAGSTTVMRLVEADATLEGASRQTLANANLARIRQAIIDHRTARTPDALLAAGGRALAAAATVAALIALTLWLSRRVQVRLQRVHERNAALRGTAIPILRRDMLQTATRRALGALRVIVVLALLVLWVEYVLSQFPATRGTARRLLEHLVAPLETMGRELVRAVPDLIFLAILYLVTRFALVLMRQYFAALERGRLSIAGFEPDWAQPTYKLLRVVAVIFALVVAYPYIPGSSTAAFQGISIFLGVVLSLGSSSAIANLIAGYSLIYRRAFKVGDLVKVAGTAGRVTAMRLQVTHLRTIKNEEVTIPNSSIMAGEVVNYSALARTSGLILHTRVGVGYETPWRQVEAMLLEAARRTHGLKSEPLPFVQEVALGDLNVTYELNAYCDDAPAMAALYAEMHRHVLDVFNEYGVQIMTPMYAGDPDEPKVVPKERWYSAPALPAGDPPLRP
jgi:small-conductance mechanosensitive channel